MRPISTLSTATRRLGRRWTASVPLDLWPRRSTSETEAHQRRVRLLTVILAALILLCVVALVAVIVDNPSGSARRSGYLALIVSILLALFSALLLNGSGHYGWAAGLVVVGGVAGPWGSVILDPQVAAGDFVPLTYAVVPILLCGILLSSRSTAAVTAVQLGLLLLFSAAVPNPLSINWPSLLIMVFFVGVLSVVGNLMNTRDLRQIFRQNRRLAESEALLRELSVRDHVSGLFNRRYLEETLVREVSRAERNGGELAVVMIDIDHFKQLNDTYGHRAGDAVLRRLGDLLKEDLRGSDMVCRYGGDELTLVLPDASREAARVRAEAVLRQARSLAVEVDGSIVPSPTLSLGVAAYPADGRTGPELLAAGDAAMYAAKEEGRDRVRLATPELVGRLALEHA